MRHRAAVGGPGRGARGTTAAGRGQGRGWVDSCVGRCVGAGGGCALLGRAWGYRAAPDEGRGHVPLTARAHVGHVGPEAAGDHHAHTRAAGPRVLRPLLCACVWLRCLNVPPNG